MRTEEQKLRSRESARRLREGSPEKIIEYRKRYFAKHPTAASDQARKRRYGVTPEQYRAMLDRQGGVCALCYRSPGTGRGRALCVDHCHSTGRIRGLVCCLCNICLRALDDGGRDLERCLKYLGGG